MPEMNFEEHFLEKLDEVLLVLGENIQKTIYHYVQTLSGLERSDIPQKPEAFSSALKLLFGNSAKIIETRIISSFCSEFEINGKDLQEESFASSLEIIRKRYDALKGCK